MLKRITFVAVCLAALPLLFAAGCATREPGGPVVRVWDAGAYRYVPADEFDEQTYINRGYFKNRDPEGNVIYVRIPKTDKPKDVTFLIGNKGGNETSFGGTGGHFTGKRGPLGIMMP